MLKPNNSIAVNVLATFAGIGAIAVPALAHHGFSGAYNAAQPIYIEGVVEKVEISAPHVEMTLSAPAGITVPAALERIEDINIKNALSKTVAAQPGSYEIQMAGTAFVRALNNRVKVGDRIALVALRNCQPPHEHRSRWIRLASGEIVTVTGHTQAEVEGCERT
jgi:hypothetical protein